MYGAAALGVAGLIFGALWYADARELPSRSRSTRLPHTREAPELPQRPLTDGDWPQVEETLTHQLRAMGLGPPVRHGGREPIPLIPSPLNREGVPRHMVQGRLTDRVEGFLAWLRQQECVLEAQPAMSGQAEGVTAYGMRATYPAQLPLRVDFRVEGEGNGEEVQTCIVTLLLTDKPTLKLLKKPRSAN